MLIDWLTLRIPLNATSIGSALHQRVMDCLGIVVCVDSQGVEQWRKNRLDLDALRSDEIGIFWSITSDGKQVYLSVGASPASLEFDGVNVFGSCDLEHCSKVLIRSAGLALSAILPDWSAWQCRRIDITANYDLGNPAQVKQALRELLGTDAPRRRTNSDRSGGDSVYWNPTSDLRSGKAYHKGPQMQYLQNRGKLTISPAVNEKIALADSLLRLELKLGSRWFRKLDGAKKRWQDLTTKDLIEEHFSFFNSLIGSSDIEVNDMGTLLEELIKVCPTKGRAMAAHNCFALIKVFGHGQVKATMAKRTFALHCHYLRLAGLSSADLCAGKVLELRKRSLVLGQPVMTWSEIRRAA